MELLQNFAAPGKTQATTAPHNVCLSLRFIILTPTVRFYSIHVFFKPVSDVQLTDLDVSSHLLIAHYRLAQSVN
jgi:hypothetical protein